jgi:hypothetical protein
MAKELKTLVEDIYSLFDPNHGHEPNEDNLNEFAENLKNLLRTRLAKREVLNNPLRFSSLGRPDRQIWYMAKGYPQEDISAKTYFKFLYGDVIEELLLFLAKESGHTVERTQEEIEVNGVKGHIDAVIDGVLVDVKSASPFGYEKFVKQTVTQNDPFGYAQQLSGYAQVITPGQAPAWLAMNKVNGSICVSPLSISIVKDYPVEERIEHLKEVIAKDEVPERCYPDEEDGKSGNRKLGTACGYCAFKFSCHPGLRVFSYANGPRFLTKVTKLPDVPEVTEQFTKSEEVY